ncbi:hypothetical protein PTKIN_Ptkin08bG0026200 [Pterospermum kingtungense]
MHAVQGEDNLEYPAWLAEESQAAENPDLNCLDSSLLCNELLDSSSLLKNSVNNQVSYTGSAHGTVEMAGNNDVSCGISELENLEFDTPPDVPLADLQFGSQESILSWIYNLSFFGLFFQGCSMLLKSFIPRCQTAPTISYDTGACVVV